MLGGIRLKVGFTHEKTCFAYINSKYSNHSDQSQCVQALFRDRQVFLWVVFNGNIPEGQMLCNPMFSRLVGLDEGVDVFVSPYGDVKILDELYVDTDSPDDQEILEHNAEILQIRILDQLRFVVANQKAVVWISVSLPIVFTPKQTGLLVNHSRINVEMDVFNSFNRKLNSPKEEPKDTKETFKNIGIVNDGMLRPYLHPPKQMVLRSIVIDSDGKRNLIHPYTVFIHEDIVNEEHTKSTVILATLQNIPSVIQDSTNDDENDVTALNDVCVEIVPINNLLYKSLCQESYNEHIKTIVIPKSLNLIFKIQSGMKVILTLIGDRVEQPEHIKVVTFSDDNETEFEVIEKFKNCVIENTHSGKKFLINNNVLKQNNHITSGYVKFLLKPERLKYTMLNSESFRYCSVSAKCLKGQDLNIPKPVKSVDYKPNNFCRNMKCMEMLVQKVISNLYFEIHREARFKGVSEIKSNVLLTGGSGTGKSTICQMVQQDLTVWSYIVHCRSLKGRKDVPEALSKAVLMCQEHSPAVLICDDVDSLVPSNMEGGSPQDIAYYQRLACVIKSVLQTCAGVSVLLTASSVNALHPALKMFNGRPLFTAQFHVPDLEQEDRAELFKHLLNERIRGEFVVEEDDVTRLAMETGGQNVRDITDYLNRKIFAAVKKKKSSKVSTKVRLLEESTKDKEKDKTLDVWAPLGGMHEVKQQLTESIFWPIMYPALFPSQSCGILLYGPPGTGKSYIGSCLAACPQFNFIAVKGPELLSKYIGQSEKAVRDVFDKAEMKRPCILFFDEFDSLAPKRGHDSTGVTDRVVNQLLARLDGAEGGAGGPVLAATSRPDLLDPALLRPGRLDTHVYCAPLNRDERAEVLRTIVKDVSISDEVDLEHVADRTEGFSAADLKSLLVTAQLTSLEDQLLSKAEDKNMETVVVSKGDLESALAETKPSLSREQLRYYDMIYKRFRGERLSQEERSLATQQQRQRVTLA